jgi:serine phosphatase RsbU (regulator of sigma subunit)/Tfp pilus assembly protein PilF
MSIYKKHLVVFYLLAVTITQAQIKQTHLPKHDTDKIVAQMQWGETFFPDKPDSCIIIMNLTVSMAKQTAAKYPLNSLEYKRLKKAEAAALNNIGYIYDNFGELQKALASYQQSLKIAIAVGDKYGQSEGYNNMAFIYNSRGDIAKALSYHQQSLTLRQQIGNNSGVADTYNSMGVIYKQQGNITKALEYYTKGLKIQEKLANKSGIANSLHNIGMVYKQQGDPAKALEYFTRSLELNEAAADKHGMTRSLSNIGSMSYENGDIQASLNYFNRALAIQKETGDKIGTARSLNSIGNAYEKDGNVQKALDYLNQSLAIFEDVGDKDATSNALCNIATIYFKQNDLTKAIAYAEKGRQLGKELGYPENILPASKILYSSYKKIGKTNTALSYYEEYIIMRDSIDNQENRKESLKSQFKYEYEKKAAADSVKVAEENKIVAVQLKQEKTQRFALYGGLALVLFFAIFIFNRFRITNKQKKIIEQKEQETQKQNEIISLQKSLVEEKHKEITDSINYAERIQRSFLATKDLLDENLKNYFVLFKPKAIVSGDFYWAALLKHPADNQNYFCLVTADSTGHGVPGAIMSLLNITSLEKATEHFTSPAEILNHTRNTIIERLSKDGSNEGGKDGMDCSLCMFDFDNKKLVVAAAHNPVWIIRGSEIIEIKGDKMPVGKHDNQHFPFSQHQIELQKDDVIYTLTDGFADQFGGKNGKKFMSKNLRDLLAKNAHLPMSKQKELLEITFNNWLGDMEQIDDITIIGIRI